MLTCTVPGTDWVVTVAAATGAAVATAAGTGSSKLATGAAETAAEDVEASLLVLLPVFLRLREDLGLLSAFL